MREVRNILQMYSLCLCDELVLGSNLLFVVGNMPSALKNIYEGGTMCHCPCDVLVLGSNLLFVVNTHFLIYAPNTL